ncbi:MAG: hypothetical protein HXY45_10810 [Syntrophaceae bacterium]|jgi:hypothetical protein|nr:hypothetical protein [Syntrophaceae bacterium]
MNWSLGGKRSFSQRRFLWVIIALAAALALYTFVVVPLGEAKKRADEEILMNQRLLQKYAEVLQNRKAAEGALDRTLRQGEEIRRRLLEEETPQLAAASLQDMAKRLATKNGLAIRSFRILDPKEVGSFRRISVQIDFNPISSMQGLTQFLYELENQEKEIMIGEADLLAFNPRMPNSVQGNLVISGYMKGNKSRDKEKDKGREKP